MGGGVEIRTIRHYLEISIKNDPPPPPSNIPSNAPANAWDE